MVVIEFPHDNGPLRASIDEYEWTCSDPFTLRQLNSLLDEDGPSPSQPNPDLEVAEEAVKLLSGVVISFDTIDRDVPGYI